jgi:hypothetical protein
VRRIVRPAYKVGHLYLCDTEYAGHHVVRATRFFADITKVYPLATVWGHQDEPLPGIEGVVLAGEYAGAEMGFGANDIKREATQDDVKRLRAAFGEAA